MKMGFLVAAVLMGVLLLGGVASADAVMGYGKCVSDCDGDKECIKDCRDMFLDEDESKELYKQEFRDCFDTCYDLRGKEKQDCLDDCRGDYKLGRDLPRD